MAIRCGNHETPTTHPTVADVRRCCASVNIERVEREMHEMEAEADREETIRDETNKANFKARMESPSAELIERVSALLVTRVVPESQHRWSRAMRAYISGDPGSMTVHALEVAIARLEAFPVIADDPEPAVPATQEGLYRLSRTIVIGGTVYRSGDLFQCLRGKQSSRLYAKLVEFPTQRDGNGARKRPTLTYVSGMIFHILESELVSVDEVNELTKGTGWCVFGHFLTNPVSVARGMGPTCYARYPHLAKNAA